MKSSDFLHELKNLKNFKDIEISSLHIDSRSLEIGGLFFALKGHNSDGSDYIDAAIEKGAVLVISDNELKNNNENIIYYGDLRKNLGLFASRFYGRPSSYLKTICVTGTNGKTTTVETLSNMSNLLGIKSGYISTINVNNGNDLEESLLTTPDPIKINSLMHEAISNDIKLFAMEASSHGLEQDRLVGLEIDYAILTSFSQDHLDYHGSLENYQASKKKLFSHSLPKSNIICIDSEFGENLYKEIKNINQNTYSVSITKDADFKATFESAKEGLKVNLKALDQEFNFELKTISRYLASNIICSIAVLMLEGKNSKDISSISKDIKLPTGRLERIFNHDNFIYIDYAHTPEALEYALKEIKRSRKGDICCVFGCGGDSDKQKRSLMGEVAERYSDHLILTNDNPRNENEKDIIDDILSGIKQPKNVVVELDRKIAIKKAIKYFEGDQKEKVLLIAGKGHESYQEIANERYTFNDKDIVSEILTKQ